MPKWFNTNLLHNILNVAVVALPALEVLDWMPLVGPENALKIVSTIGLIKIIVNVGRDGITGMAKEQPPVKT